jgi:ribonucleoside-diphosphate reductase alpha chain
VKHIAVNKNNEKYFDKNKLQATIKNAIRMLDNVIDLNFYPPSLTDFSLPNEKNKISKANYSNLLHRPIGLGMMGLQDLFFELDLPFLSKEAFALNDEISELFSYCAIKSSNELAKVRGKYSTFDGSKWSLGIFPHDTIELLARSRNREIKVENKETLD